MKITLSALLLLLISAPSFAQSMCRIKGTNSYVGLADQGRGVFKIYITGRGYYPITSQRLTRIYSIGSYWRVMLDMQNNVLEVNEEKYQLSGCRAVGE